MEEVMNNTITNFSKLVIVTKAAFKNKELLTSQKLLRSLDAKDQSIIQTLQSFGIIERQVVLDKEQLKYKLSTLDKTVEVLESNIDFMNKQIEEIELQKEETLKLITYLKSKDNDRF